MVYQIIKGEDLGESLLSQIMEIDRICYEDEYVGELSQMVARYKKNKETFVCAVDENGCPIGYVNFFPVIDALWEEIIETGMVIRDDDIMPEEIAEYSKDEMNYLFIISIAILPAYRKDKNVMITLSNAFISYLNGLQEKGYKIGGIAGTAVSEGGRKCLERWNFRRYRKIKDENIVYLCDGPYLKKFLKNDLYIKTYKDDIFLFIPYAENKKNEKINKLFWSNGEYVVENSEKKCDIPDPEKILMSELDACLKYEYQSSTVHELERVYLGEFLLLHTSDEYVDEEDPTAYPVILGEETVYISLLAHRKTHMYIVQLFVPESQYSSSQLEDQLSHGYLKIRKEEDIDSKGFYVYQNLNTYLKEKYGLFQCGKGKCILCMSNQPENEQEFYNILTAESYNSIHQNFFISCKELEEIAKNNHAVYNYYELYMTERVLAFILKEYDSFDLDTRIQLTATYVFIVEIIMLQNTALNKMTIKVSDALSHEGDTSFESIDELYHEYAMTLPLLNNDNFKYFGTQKEADKVKRAFENEELRRNYYEQQEFLEHMVELKNAKDEKRNGMVINIAAIGLALLEAQNYLVLLFQHIYGWLGIGIPEASANATFDTLFFGGSGLLLIVWYTHHKKQNHLRKKKLSEMVERKEK